MFNKIETLSSITSHISATITFTIKRNLITKDRKFYN